MRKTRKVEVDGELVTVEEGSDNVFADLGFENPEEMQAKSALVFAINNLMASHGLTQAAAAKLAGLQQPHLNAIVRGRIDNVSFEKLFRVLNALGGAITIEVTATPANRPGLSVKTHAGAWIVAERSPVYVTGKRVASKSKAVLGQPAKPPKATKGKTPETSSGHQ